MSDERDGGADTGVRGVEVILTLLDRPGGVPRETGESRVRFRPPSPVSPFCRRKVVLVKPRELGGALNGSRVGGSESPNGGTLTHFHPPPR